MLINITKTTAPHAVSYPFTTYYNIPHGHAVSLTFVFFLKYNYNLNKDNCNDSRGVDFVKEKLKKLSLFMGCSNIENLCEELNLFLGKIGIETNLNKLNISQVDIENNILNNINYERVKNNPRKLKRSDLFAYFKTKMK